MRIAYFSPLNPQPTGISDYSEELLPALADFAEIDVFVSGFVPSNPWIRRTFVIRSFDEFPTSHAKQRYDVNLYQMGNSIHHARIHRMLMQYPGVVVLHDIVLHHFFLELTFRENNPLHYLSEMLYDHGSDGLARGLEVLRGTSPPPFFESPLLGRLIEASLGIVVHSEFARAQVAAYRNANVAVVPPHIVPQSSGRRGPRQLPSGLAAALEQPRWCSAALAPRVHRSVSKQRSAPSRDYTRGSRRHTS